MPRWAVAVVVAAPLLLAACGGATPTSVPSGSTSAGSPAATQADSGPSAAEVASASTVLTSVILDSADSLAALEGVRLTPAGAAAAADLIKSGATGDALWAATYVYASSGDDTAPLTSIVRDTSASPSVRVMAAAGLVGRGDLAGFEPLIAALATTEPMEGTEPAGTTSEFASDVLERYAQTGFGPALTASADERTASQAKWTAWLASNRATLRFDDPSASWVTR
jgi:hypothetical protein